MSKKIVLVLIAACFILTSCAPKITPKTEENEVVENGPDAPNTWDYTGSLNQARGDHTQTLLNTGQILITGGTTTGNNSFSSCELYDL